MRAIVCRYRHGTLPTSCDNGPRKASHDSGSRASIIHCNAANMGPNKRVHTSPKSLQNRPKIAPDSLTFTVGSGQGLSPIEFWHIRLLDQRYGGFDLAGQRLP